MPTTINADVTFGGYIVTADASGTLALQASGNTALTVNPQRAIGVGQTPSFGTAGQVLVSGGNATAPAWTNLVTSLPITTYSGSVSLVPIASGYITVLLANGSTSTSIAVS
jgi:hypothetical protein